MPDVAKEQAQEGYVLRQACRKSWEKFELNVEINNNKLVMKDSVLSYSVKDLPEYLKVKKWNLICIWEVGKVSINQLLFFPLSFMLTFKALPLDVDRVQVFVKICQNIFG